ncbi:MAG: hypothetical protein QNJ54_03020 [Prochloraceae cyanobacterium]|nr:hypothetical protein [Prochloraceae cyanobacterium]
MAEFRVITELPLVLIGLEEHHRLTSLLRHRLQSSPFEQLISRLQKI